LHCVARCSCSLLSSQRTGGGQSRAAGPAGGVRRRREASRATPHAVTENGDRRGRQLPHNGTVTPAPARSPLGGAQMARCRDPSTALLEVRWHWLTRGSRVQRVHRLASDRRRSPEPIPSE
jgi:hypothetical protein